MDFWQYLLVVFIAFGLLSFFVLLYSPADSTKELTSEQKILQACEKYWLDSAKSIKLDQAKNPSKEINWSVNFDSDFFFDQKTGSFKADQCCYLAFVNWANDSNWHPEADYNFFVKMQQRYGTRRCIGFN